jgi:hypothetical protein
VLEIETPAGPARAMVQQQRAPLGSLVLGHGAGGSVSARDLMAVTRAAGEAGFTVALIEQPYRVAGRKSQPPAAQLDQAWVAVVTRLRADGVLAEPLVAGGRSAGARVACRTAAEIGAAGVLCLAFPVHPPGQPEKSRLDELDTVDVPVLVVQGVSDPFGMPPDAPGREVVRLKGDHSLAGDFDGLTAAVREWLPKVAAHEVR